jgi:hypothetical protein
MPMSLTRREVIAGSLGLIVATQLPSEAEAARWRVLGAKTVSLGIDRDVIRVSPFNGKFDKIKVRAYLNDIELFDLSVVYGNGKRDDIRVRRIVRKNTETKPLDLRGDARFLKRIEMIYRKNPRKGLFALVTVLGRVA